MLAVHMGFRINTRSHTALQELQDQVKVLTDLKKYLHGVLGQPADGDDESTAVESPTHQASL